MRLSSVHIFPLALDLLELSATVAFAVGYSLPTWIDGVAYGHMVWAMRLEHLGRIEEANPHWRKADQQYAAGLAQTDRHPFGRAVALSNRAVVLARLDRVGDATAALDESSLIRIQPIDPALLVLRRLHADSVVHFVNDKGQARDLLNARWQEAVRHAPFAEDAAHMLHCLALDEHDWRSAEAWDAKMHEYFARTAQEAWRPWPALPKVQIGPDRRP